MLDRLHARISGLASWPVLALVIFGGTLCTIGFGVRTKILTDAIPLDASRKGHLSVQLLDPRTSGYTRQEAGQLLDLLGVKGRNIYAWTEVTLDLVFPFVYGLLFAILLVRLYEPRQAWVLAFPIAAVAADLLENVTVATLAWTHRQGEVPALATGALAFTLAKTAFTILTILLVAFRAFRSLSSRRA